ncbi:MAG: putative Ig domain-containing protein, partial [Magnetococcales bacterium]|nr:putative Ig domain-containing protein [Magnetococcales bacterium]
TVTVSDVDDTQLSGATVTISNGLTSGDVLAVTTQNGISGLYNSATGVLTLSGTASLANYQTALRSVTFTSTSDDPTATAASRTVTWAVTDANSDGVGAQTSTGVTSTINLIATADAPVVTAGGTSKAVNGAAIVIDSTITVSDADDTQLVGATVTISSGLATGDVLAVTSQNGISGTYNSATGILTLTGTTTLANYQTVLRSVTFANTGSSPTAASRSVTWVVTDANSDSIGAAKSTGVTSTISMAAVNQAPTLTLPATIQVNEDLASPLSGMTFADSDAGSSAVVATFTVDSGTLQATSSSTVTVGGSATALTLTGKVSDINIFIAGNGLNFVTATNALSDVALSVTINDQGATGSGGALSASATGSLKVTAINDAPTVVKTLANQSGREGTAFETQFAADIFADVDQNDTVTYSATTATGSLPSWLAFNAANRTFSGTPKSNDSGVQEILITATDKAGATVTARFTLTIADVPTPQPPASVVLPPPPPSPASLPDTGRAPVVTFNAGSSNLSSLSSSSVAPVVTFALPPAVLSTTPVLLLSTPLASSTFSSLSNVPSSANSPVLVARVPATTAPTPAAQAQVDSRPSAPAPTSATPVSATPVTSSPMGGGFHVTASPSSVPSGQTGLFLAEGIPDVSSSGGRTVDFAVPPTAFAHSDNAAVVQLAAQMDDGQALPTWLKFDATTGQFSGTPPSGTNADVAIKVIARDSTGKEVAAVFHLKVGNPVSNSPANAPQTNDQGAEFLEKYSPWLKVVRLNALRDRGGVDSGLWGGKLGFSHQMAVYGHNGIHGRAMMLQRAAEGFSRKSVVS